MVRSRQDKYTKMAHLKVCIYNMTVGKLDPSLADINHVARSGGQRLLLPTSVTRADLKPIVEEQGFHLLGKDIAQG